MLPEWTSKLKFLFIGKSRRDVDDEIQFHIERQIEANLAEGMSIDEARLQANITFGGRQRTREQCREERPSFPIESLARDLRYGMRGLLRNPGFACVAVPVVLRDLSCRRLRLASGPARSSKLRCWHHGFDEEL